MKEEKPPKLNRTRIPCDCVYKTIQHKRILGIKDISFGCGACNGTGKINKDIHEIRNDAVV